MAHNVQTYIGRNNPWWNLAEATGKATVTGNYVTWQEVLAHRGFDFDVTKEQLQDRIGRMVDAFGIYRWDKGVTDFNKAIFLGSVGKDYTPINHVHGFEMVDALMNTTDGAHYETAGVLGNGETVWGLADLGLTAHVGDDKHVMYLAFMTGHIGNVSYQLRITDIRIQCQNTMNMALSRSTSAKFSVKHTKLAQNRIADAKQVLEGLKGEVKSIEEKLNFLAKKKVTREAMVSVLDRLFPPKLDDRGTEIRTTRRDNILSSILSLYESNDNNAFPEQRGTSYNLLNSITNYVDHERSTHGDRRAESALFGSGDKMKTNALEMILAESEKLPDITRTYTTVQRQQMDVTNVFPSLKAN